MKLYNNNLMLMYIQRTLLDFFDLLIRIGIVGFSK